MSVLLKNITANLRGLREAALEDAKKALRGK